MRVLYVSTTLTESVLVTGRTLREMGHEPYFFSDDPYHVVASYPKKKLRKLGYKRGENAYRAAQEVRLIEAVASYRPDRVIYFNLEPNSIGLFAKIEKYAPIRSLLIDPIVDNIGAYAKLADVGGGYIRTIMMMHVCSNQWGSQLRICRLVQDLTTIMLRWRKT